MLRRHKWRLGRSTQPTQPILRAQNSAGPLTTIACENGIGAGRQRHLWSIPSTNRWWNERPLAAPDKNSKSRGVLFVDDLRPYLERKPCTVNTGHCAAACLGYLKGYQTIQEALADSELRRRASNVLGETSEVLIRKFGFDRGQHEDYIRTTIERFANTRVSDEITHVARSPVRELTKGERLVPVYIRCSRASAARSHREAVQVYGTKRSRIGIAGSIRSVPTQSTPNPKV